MIPNLDEPSEVLPGLLVGSWETATNPEIRRAHGITHVLSLAEEGAPCFESSVAHHFCPLSDYGLSELEKSIDQPIAFIDSGLTSGGTVLAHCLLGVNRSPTVCMAYLVRAKGWTLRASFEHLCRVRVFVAPHSRYVKQLRAIEASVRGETTLSVEEVEAYLGKLSSNLS